MPLASDERVWRYIPPSLATTETQESPTCLDKRKSMSHLVEGEDPNSPKINCIQYEDFFFWEREKVTYPFLLLYFLCIVEGNTQISI